MPASSQVSLPSTDRVIGSSCTHQPVTSSSTRSSGGLETTPLVFIGVGGSLAVVGSVPLVITLSLGVNSSATIIGVGFVGFGFLIIVPGLCWCLVANVYGQCGGSDGFIARQRRRRRRHVRRLSAEQEVELLVLKSVFTLKFSCSSLFSFVCFFCGRLVTSSGAELSVSRYGKKSLPMGMVVQ